MSNRRRGPEVKMGLQDLGPTKSEREQIAKNWKEKLQDRLEETFSLSNQVSRSIEDKYGEDFNFISGLDIVGSDKVIGYLDSESLDWNDREVSVYLDRLAKYRVFLESLNDNLDDENKIKEIIIGELSGDLRDVLDFTDQVPLEEYEKFVQENKDESNEPLNEEEIDEIEKELCVNENGMWESSIRNLPSYQVVDFDPDTMEVKFKKEGDENIFSTPLGKWRKIIDVYTFVKVGESIEDVEEGGEKTVDEQKKEATDKAQELINFIDANAEYIIQIKNKKTKEWIERMKNSAKKLIELAPKKNLKQISEWYGKNSKTDKFNTSNDIIARIEANIRPYAFKKRLDIYLNEFSTNVLNKLEELKTKHSDEEDVVSAIQTHIEKIKSAKDEFDSEEGLDKFNKLNDAAKLKKLEAFERLLREPFADTSKNGEEKIIPKNFFTNKKDNGKDGDVEEPSNNEKYLENDDNTDSSKSKKPENQDMKKQIKDGERRKKEFEEKYGYGWYRKKWTYRDKRTGEQKEGSEDIYVNEFIIGFTPDEDRIVVLSDKGRGGSKIGFSRKQFEKNYLNKGFEKELEKKADKKDSEVVRFNKLSEEERVKEYHIGDMGAWFNRDGEVRGFPVPSFRVVSYEADDNEVNFNLYYPETDSYKRIPIQELQMKERTGYKFEEESIQDLQDRIVILNNTRKLLLGQKDIDRVTFRKVEGELRRIQKHLEEKGEEFNVDVLEDRAVKNSLESIKEEIEEKIVRLDGVISLRESLDGADMSEVKDRLDEVKLKSGQFDSLVDASRIEALKNEIDAELSDISSILEERNTEETEVPESNFNIGQSAEERDHEELQRVREQIQNGGARLEPEVGDVAGEEIGVEINSVLTGMGSEHINELENVKNRGFVRGILDKFRKIPGVGAFGRLVDRVKMHDSNTLVNVRKDKINLLQSQIVGYKETLEASIYNIRELEMQKGELISQGVYTKGMEKRLAKMKTDVVKIKSNIEKASSEIQQQQGEMAEYVKNRDILANKFIERYETKLGPLEAKFRSLENQRDQIELVNSVYRVKVKEYKAKIDKLEELKVRNQTRGVSNRVLNRQLEDLRRIRGSLINKIADTEIKVDLDLRQLEFKINPCKRKINELKRIKGIRPSRVEVEPIEEVVEPEYESLRFRTERGYEGVDGNFSFTDENIESGEAMQEREGTIGYYIDKLNAYAQNSEDINLQRMLRIGKPEFMNLPPVRRINRTQMEFDDFKNIVKAYLNYKGVRPADSRFNSIMTNFKVALDRERS